MKRALGLVCAILAANVLIAVSQIPPPLATTCPNAVDLVFLVDSSESFRTSGFQDALTFVQDVVNYFTLGEDETRVGVVTFSNEDEQVTRVRLNERYNRVDLLTAIRAIPYDRGHTFTGLGLDHVRNNSFLEVNGRRSDTLDFLVVLTDDLSEDSVTRPAQLIRDMGITVFVVGVGQESDISQATLVDIAGDQSRVFRLTDHEFLVDAIHAQSIRESICNAAQCPALTAPTNGARTPPTGANSYQNVVSFTCDTGYTRNGDASVTCQRDQTWTAPPPTCEPVQCPARTAPANGAVSSTVIRQYQDVVTFTCNSGYNLVGSTTITCLATGAWSAAPPTCNPVQCQTRTGPTNGARTPPTGGNFFSNMVTFTCNTGYVLNGPASVTCRADGTWSNNDPTCTPRQCSPVLTAPANGALSTTARTYQTVVTTTCDAGYVLNGAPSTTCQADGTWSNLVPTCTRRQCSVLAAPANGARAPPTGATSYQDTVTFSCDTGYTLTGASSRTCQADGTWSATSPTCTPRPCPTLTAPTNGQLSPAGPHAYPNQVTFTCNSGYVLNGAATTTCQTDGTWSNPVVPTCTRRQCLPALTAPANGARTPATGANLYQDAVSFTCDSGYVLNGAASVTCRADGTWSTGVPTCTRRQCQPALTAPTNGARTPATGATSYQDTVTFSCNTGYVLNGAATSTCQADGTWTNPVAPTCTPVQCPPLTTPTNGARTPPTGATAYQSQVTFTCDSGYVLNGAATLTCQSDSTWNNAAPTCQPRQCSPVLTAPANGALSTTARTYQTVVSFTCDSGYTRNGATDTTCQADGTWSNPVHSCTLRQCSPVLTAPANGALSTTARTYQTVVTTTCNAGFTRSGAATATCQADGTWSNTVPTCTSSTGTQCQALTAPTNGVLSPSPGPHPYQQVVTFTCNTGYQLSGNSITRCQADATWSNAVPICTSDSSSTSGLSQGDIAAIAGGSALGGVILLAILAAVFGGAAAGKKASQPISRQP
ncbi:CSMD3 [Branchiostoma lanceolatum]|uniref:CSMD3 protein n=1 Tax=Branchiostoma lanceolatum TaxID=7740 RepID=A0A8J9ZGP9_BRALA|nr:CSMD3 [Branchiostoma lanceolatum]